MMVRVGGWKTIFAAHVKTRIRRCKKYTIQSFNETKIVREKKIIREKKMLKKTIKLSKQKNDHYS